MKFKVGDKVLIVDNSLAQVDAQINTLGTIEKVYLNGNVVLKEYVYVWNQNQLTNEGLLFHAKRIREKLHGKSNRKS